MILTIIAWVTTVVLALGILIFLLELFAWLTVTLTALSAGIRYCNKKIALNEEAIRFYEYNLKRLETYWDECAANGWSHEKAVRRWDAESQFVKI